MRLDDHIWKIQLSLNKITILFHPKTHDIYLMCFRMLVTLTYAYFCAMPKIT